MHSASRRVLHLDADAFFASVEQRDNPSLRGRPVAVGTGVVASCSYESRRFGVRTGMRLAEARVLCRDLIVLPGDYRRYEQAARRMQAICLDHTPLVEVPALDDLYLDLTALLRLDGPKPRAVGEMLRRTIRDEVGLSVSVGIGTSKLLAKVATRQAKPGGVVLVEAGDEERYLAPWPVEVLPGVGPKTQDRLARLNVRKVGELAAVPPAVLAGLFGRVGLTLHQFAHGLDSRPVVPDRPQQSVSRRASFDPPTAELPFITAMLDHLLERAIGWLRLQKLACRGLGVTIHYGDYASLMGRESFRRPVEDERQLREAARDRLLRVYQRRLPLRLVGVELAPLGPPDAQPSLFADPSREKGQRLAECKDAIRKRFGFMAVQNGSALVLADRLEQDRENFRLRTPCLSR